MQSAQHCCAFLLLLLPCSGFILPKGSFRTASVSSAVRNQVFDVRSPSSYRSKVLQAAIVMQSGSGYWRSEGDDAEIDVAVVESLLDQRQELRSQRDYDGADAVREELTAMGVSVYDRSQEWCVNKQRGNGRSDGGSWGGGWDKTYTRMEGDTAEVDLEAVEALIEERTNYRSTRDYASADAVRDQLVGMGIFIQDREQTWCVGRPNWGRQWDENSGPRPVKDFGPLGHDYLRAPNDATELTDVQLEEINDLLRQRLEAKMTRQFTEADELLLQLNALNVQVNDGKKAWRGDGLGFGQRGYERLNVEDGPNADVEKIEGLIVERGQAKKMRDYDRADAIREDLLVNHCVVLDDKERTWKVFKQFGGYDLDGEAPDDIKTQADKLLTTRLIAQCQKQYPKADAAQDQLRALGIHLDNRSKTWRYQPPISFASEEEAMAAFAGSGDAIVDAPPSEAKAGGVQSWYDAGQRLSDPVEA